MSETQTIVANLKEVVLNEGETLEERLSSIYPDEKIEDYNSIYDMMCEIEWQAEEGDQKYKLLNNKLYVYNEIINSTDYNDIVEAFPRESDGSIDVVIQWYNGGAGDNEVLEEALNKIK